MRSQIGFSWSSVAIAGIGAGLGASVSKQLNLTDALGQPTSNSLGNDLGRAAVNAGANALSQLAIRGGKINWQQVATDTILNFAQNTGQRYANANALNDTQIAKAKQTPVAGVNANDDPTYSTRPKGSFTQDLLSSSQVEAAAFNDKPNFNGLRASYVDSPEQLNAKNGGVNFSYGDALGNGVVYGAEQYMKGMPNAVVNNVAENATRQVKSGVSPTPKMDGVQSLYYQTDPATGLYIDPETNLPSFALSSQIQRQIADRNSISNRELADRAIRANNAGNAVRFVDGSKNPSLTPEQASAKFAKDVAEGVYVAPTIGVTALALSSPVALPVAAYSRLAFAGLSARALTTAGAVNTGVGMTVNASFQIASGKDFSYVDLGVSGLTSFATTGATILPSLYINTLGAYGGSLVQLENPIPSLAGAGAGSVTGSGVSGGLDFVSKTLPSNKYTQPIKQMIKNGGSAFISGVAQEKVGNDVKDNFSR